ncbi:MAG: PP2C family protein-serine/threonine phosphatase [Thermodesulfobacteriota bacterium]
MLTSHTSADEASFKNDSKSLETATLEAIREKEFGTVLGPGHPPDRISGFYRLQEAPWYLLIIAPGREIFKPIIHLRNFYLLMGTGFILVILLLIRWVTGRTVSDIRGVSETACRIAGGEHQDPLPVTSRDEVGELIGSFNTMLVKLKERDRLKSAIHLAREVQQNLLPDNSMRLNGLDIVGKSIYCDETGGDYYDFIPFSDDKGCRIGIAVGDVAGHGISAALLMTTVRALLRCRATQPGSISEMMTDINRLLCLDTGDSGNFMTLFLMVVDSAKGEIRWVRAGHDPALIYDPDTDAFVELTGEGFVLGVDDEWKFEEYAHSGWKENQMALIGTDGIWETENPHGAPYGKERLRNLIRRHHADTPARVMRAVIYDLAAFRGDAKQEDDVTMVIIKGSNEYLT